MTGYAFATALAAPLDDGRKTIGRARGARDNLHFSLVFFRVDADDNGRCVCVLGWGRNNDFLRAALDMLHATLSGGEGTSGFANIVNASFAPRNLCGITRGREGDGKTTDFQAIFHQLHGAIKAAVHGVVLE